MSGVTASTVAVPPVTVDGRATVALMVFAVPLLV